jgi:hypothetical protein
MATEAQIAANRRNARLSTGPKSRKGKEKARENALRHGLYAQDLTALGEVGEDFAAYAAALATALKPQDTYEALLIRRVVLASWRSDRLVKLEAALLDGEARNEARRRGHPGIIPDDVWPDALVPLARHEAALDRAIQRAMTLLERYRAARRRGELPTASDIENFAERTQLSAPIQRLPENEANAEPNPREGGATMVTVP